MRASNIGSAPDTYPDRYRGEPSPFERAVPEWPGPPMECTFEIEGYHEVDDEPIRRALWAAGWANDRLTVLGRLVATHQAAGCYYAGVLVPVHEDHWRLRLTLIEEG